MEARIIAVAVGGVLLWALLKWAEEAAGDRTGAFFRVAKLALVVVVFCVEFMLTVVIPTAGEDAIRRTYEPTPYESVGGPSRYP